MPARGSPAGRSAHRASTIASYSSLPARYARAKTFVATGCSAMSNKVMQLSLRPISTTAMAPNPALMVSPVRLRPAVVVWLPLSARTPSPISSETRVDTVLGDSSVFWAISTLERPSFSRMDWMMTWRLRRLTS